MQHPVLVTGGAGFIGSNLVRHYIQETDLHVINVDKLTYAGNLESLKEIADSPRYIFEQVDIVDYIRLKTVFETYQPQAIIHLAAESHVDRSIDGPDSFIQTNIVGTFNLLDISRNYFESLSDGQKKLFRFLHVSTDEVYGSLELDQPGFSETTRYDPHSPYSASKASSDHLVRSWGETYGLPVLITNCSNNYGPYQFPEKLVPLVILRAIQGQPIPVYGRGENIRDWLYVEDHVKAIELVLNKGTIGSTYNVGGENERKNIDLVNFLCEILDELLPVGENNEIVSSGISSYRELITFVEDRPGHDLRYAIDANRIQTELNWKPLEDFQTGFRRTVEWYLENRQWCENILSGEYKLNRLGLAEQKQR